MGWIFRRVLSGWVETKDIGKTHSGGIEEQHTSFHIRWNFELSIDKKVPARRYEKLQNTSYLLSRSTVERQFLRSAGSSIDEFALIVHYAKVTCIRDYKKQKNKTYEREKDFEKLRSD